MTRKQTIDNPMNHQMNNRLLKQIMCVVAASGLLTLTACGDDSSLTYHKDIAPIMVENCVSCHRAGEIAPFSLTGYESVKRYARASLTSMKDRTMPPWTVNNSGSCQSYEGTAWLSDDDIAAFAEWIDADMPEGDKDDAPPAYKPPPSLSGFTHEIATPAYSPHSFYHPDTALKTAPARHDGETHDNLPADDYRCFMVDLDTSVDRYLTAFEVLSSRPEMAHHMILYLLSGDAVTAAQGLELTGETGYECFGGPGVALTDSSGNFSASNVRSAAGWAPGTPPTIYPESTGIKIPAGAVPVIQMHYNTENGISEDVTRIRMILEDSISKEAFFLPVANLDMQLAPGQTKVTASSEFKLGELLLSGGYEGITLDVNLYGTYPHMHKRGLSLKLEETTPGKEQCLTRVDRWDFDWQRFYFYKKPLELEVSIDTKYRLSCSYNTFADTAPVFWGDGTDDEMCLDFLYVNIPVCDSPLIDCGI